MLLWKLKSDFNKESLLYTAYIKEFFTGSLQVQIANEFLKLFSLLAERVQSLVLNFIPCKK